MAGAIGSAISGILSAISGAGRAASGAIASAGNWLAGRSAAPNLAYARALPVPALAAGAVIPPNRAFLALLGDQRSGTNVEAPLATIQQAVADVMQDLQDGELAALEQVAAQLQQIQEAIYGNPDRRRGHRPGRRPLPAPPGRRHGKGVSHGTDCGFLQD